MYKFYGRKEIDSQIDRTTVLIVRATILYALKCVCEIFHVRVTK